jgi:peptidyl-tRNA hydrolase, PTH1 family
VGVEHGTDGETKIVVGLGNPGRRYRSTRHNLGFRVVETLVDRWALGEGRKAFGGLFHDGRVSDPAGAGFVRVLLLQPHTFMNRSGEAAKGLAAFYKVPAENVLVVLDDMALPVGRLRLRPGGSAGGHKGLLDVQRLLGTMEIPRVRVGIGEPPPQMDAVDYVLQAFGADEQETVNEAIVLAANAVQEWLFSPMAKLMGKYNGIDLERKNSDESDHQDL